MWLPALFGTILGTGLNTYATSETNKANKEIAQEANELNYQMFNEGNQFNERMWNLSNEFNLPVNQRKRVEEAGYSPYLLASNGQLGQMASPASSTTPNGAVTAHMQPYDFSMLGRIGENLQQYATAKKNIAEARKTDKEADYVSQLSEAQVKSLVANGFMTEQQGNKYLQEIAFKDSNWNSLSKQVDQQAYETSEQARKLKLENDLKEEFGRGMMNNEVRKQVEEIALLVQKGETEKALQMVHHSTVLRNKQEGIAAIINAYANKDLSESQVNVNEEIRRERKLHNDVYELFGKPKEAAEFLKAYYEGDVKKVDAFFKQLQAAPYSDKSKVQGLWQALYQSSEMWHQLNPIKGIFPRIP